MLTRWPESNLRGFPNTVNFFHEFQKELDGLFRGFGLREFPQATQLTYPRINLYDKGEYLLFVAEVPGMTKEDLELSVNAESITLKGERKQGKPENASVHRLERGQLHFKRSFNWPVAIDVEKVEATLKDGLLEVQVAKAPEAKPRNIEVKVK